MDAITIFSKPDEVAALRALVLVARAERDTERAEKARLIEERDQLAGQNDRLRHLIRQLQRMQFSRRSEKLDPDQFNLALEDLEQAVATSEAEQEKADPALRTAHSEKRRAGRGALPEHLPRIEIVPPPAAPGRTRVGRRGPAPRNNLSWCALDPDRVPGPLSRRRKAWSSAAAPGASAATLV